MAHDLNDGSHVTALSLSLMDQSNTDSLNQSISRCHMLSERHHRREEGMSRTEAASGSVTARNALLQSNALIQSTVHIYRHRLSTIGQLTAGY